METATNRMNRSFFIGDRLFLVADDTGRFMIPKKFYETKEDAYQPYYVYTEHDMIHIVIDRERPSLRYATRIYIPVKANRILKLKGGDVFECKKCEDGFILERANLEVK